MEISYDWVRFQSFFVLNQESQAASLIQGGKVYLVVHQRLIVSVYCNCLDLTRWIGSTTDEIFAAHPNEEFWVLEKTQIDGWISAGLPLAHLYEQIECYHKEVKAQVYLRGKSRQEQLSSENHFLLKAIKSWWNRVLPLNYGVYIELDGRDDFSILLGVQRGKIVSFHKHDLSPVIRNRKLDQLELVKHLSERYLMPVQGFFLTEEEWVQWSNSAHPWAQLSNALRSNKGKIVPINRKLLFLISARAQFGI